MEPTRIAESEDREVYDLGKVPLTAKGFGTVTTWAKGRKVEAISMTRDGTTVRVHARVCPKDHGRQEGAYCAECGSKLVNAE
jgi:hypothetical protein